VATNAFEKSGRALYIPRNEERSGEGASADADPAEWLESEVHDAIKGTAPRVFVPDEVMPTQEVRPNAHARRNPLDVLRGTVIRNIDPDEPLDVEWRVASN